MGQTSYSSSSFWAKQIGIAVVLVIAAGVLIYILQTNEQAPAPASQKEDKSVSKGLSDFYRDFRMSATDPKEEEQGDFVIDIAGVDANLDSKLAKMSSQTRPVEKDWTGEYKNRAFREGNTLREAISQYAQAEGMQVIWNLEQDFVIKYQFQLDNTVSGSLAKIASAIDSSFEGEVKAYLCAEQRSLVVTAEETEFLSKNCRLLRA
ncbi:TcpQ domain-containing protein [Alteromonas sp. IB21]|uniref:TcpQ domain-containing protein n=1 Tax=Alteromonas sp. IB21 TaxID=2779369 RepID=UPI0018E726B6|nr:TcpQ domain-containing protein [Alteromonas sp. IB21]MBJ2130284.1 TcpQ domain-containing protein [Alteromonas sp. IB21]